MDTFFAPAARADHETVIHDYNLFTGFGQVNELINALPVIAAVLNEQRQVVYGNKPLLKAMGFKEFEEVLGLRPGELINCIHSREMQGGCGTSRSCRVCGAVDAIQECLNTNMKIVNECRITANQEDKEISYDFKVTASPFEYQGKRFVILSFEDISDEKRRQILERLFFHDIINTASGLRGFIEFMEMSNDPAEHKEYLTIASRLSDVLIEEIISQRQLLAAERGELKVNKVAVDINDLITETIQQIAHHQVAKTIPIVFVNAHENLNFTTDPVLLKRVLLNLLKNAVEASKPNQQVEIGFSTNNNNEVIISVKNDTIMSQEIQLQIFQRSFSTKGEARGIGTYSIKMFTEQYLGGKVSFVSNSTEKTVFSISLPLA